MRKSFTRLFSIFILLCGLSLQMALGIGFDGTKSVPVDANPNVKPADIATKFVVAFDAVPQISAAGGTLVIYKGANLGSLGLYKTYPISTSSSSVKIVGKTLEVTHGLSASSFVQGEVYSVAITDGAIVGLANGALASGIYDFTVGDYVNPSLKTAATDFTPNKGGTSVMANLDGSAVILKVPFDENVTVPATALLSGNKAVYVYKEDGTIVDIVKVGNLATGVNVYSDAAATTALTAAGAMNVYVKIANTAIFAENTKYYVRIDAGAFVDVNANKMEYAGLNAPATWTFTTRDYSAPAITASISNVAVTSAKLNVSLTEKGKFYYLVQTAATADPANAAAVKAAPTGTVTVNTANTIIDVTLAVAGSTDYEVFVVAENNEAVSPNLSSTFVKKTFTTIDNVAPTQISRGILANADKKTNAIYMVFNEQVKGGSGSLDLRLNSNDSYVKSVTADAISSTKITTAADATKYGAAINDWVVLIDLGMTLPSKTDYYVVFPAGFIIDMATPSNAFAGAGFIVPINKGNWAFTSTDFEKPVPTIAFATPASLASDITITFDETVTKQLPTTTDWAQVLALEVNNVAVPFTVTAPLLAANGTQIVIDPTPALSANTTYTVRIRPDAVKDLGSVSLATVSANAITTEFVKELTTGDLSPLAVTYGSDLGAAVTTNLLANSKFVIDFNKAISVNTTGTTWVAATAQNLTPFITVTKTGAPNAGTKTFTVDYDPATFTITITPSDALLSNATDYDVFLNGAKVRDSQNVVLNTVVSYAAAGITTYTVKDYEKPVAANSHSGNVQNTAPNANPTITFTDANLGTLTDLSNAAIAGLAANQLATHITFKEGSSNGQNLGFSAAYAPGTGVITITPTVALATGKTYYYGIGASVKDGNNNVTDGKFTTFTMVAPAVAPSIVANTYTVNTSAQTAVNTALENVVPVSNKVTVTVTFNDNVKEFTGNPISLTDGTTTWNVNITSANVSGNVLTVDFPTGASIASDATCTLTLPAALVQGSSYIAGTTNFAQFAGKVITFKSKDTVKPTASANTPIAGAGSVALNTDIKINFDEKVVLGTGNILIKEGATVVQTIPVNATNVSLNAAGTVATITKVGGDLPKYFTTYTLEVPVTAFTDDVSLNQLSAVYSGTFTTVVNPQPTASVFTPADGSDQLPLSPLSLGITFSEDVVKYTPVVGTRKLWYLIEEGNAGIRASFDAALDLTLGGGNDVPVANDYIENSSVNVSGKNVTIVTGFTPVANKRYYVLITPGAFLDKSTGNSSLPANPVAGVFAGVTAGTTWNFTTIDENAGSVSYEYTKRTDGLVATTSDIVIKFTRPIVKADGSAITDAQVANLFTLTKTGGPGTLGIKAFIGTISADKKTVTILNSSLVTLGEMTAGSRFTIASNAGAIKYANGAAAGASDNFITSNYDKPTVATVFQSTGLTTPTVVDIYKDAADGKHKAKIQFDCNANPASVAGVQTNMKKLYYTIEEGTAPSASMTASIIMLSNKKEDLTGVATLNKTYTFTDLAEETSYVVYAVVEDEAGNISNISTLVFTTDDVTKPTLVTKPTAFDSNKKLSFTFSEAISVVGNPSVRILEKGSMQELVRLNLNTVAGAGNEAKMITDAWAGLSTADAIVNYYVEVDAGMVGDVPVVAGDVVNTFDGLFRTDCEVASKDATAPAFQSSTPNLAGTTPAAPALDAVNNFSIKLTFSEPVKKVSTIPVDAFVVKQYNTTTAVFEPFEVIDPSNVVTNGTADVYITPSRMLASATIYELSVKLNSFEDLEGTDHAAATIVGYIKTKDIAAPAVTFAPSKGQNNVALASAITIDFNEVIRLLDNSVIDNYDLDSLVYFKKNGTNVAFDAAITNPTATTSRITITPGAALVSDASYTYGFKAKFEDASNNAIAADEATFNTILTVPAAQYLSWAPAKKSPYAAPWTWVASAGVITLNFTHDIFTHEAVAANNNLPVTPARIAANGIITVNKNGAAMAYADLKFTTPDTKTITVAPKDGTNWGSSSVIEVVVNGDKLQINEGNVTILGVAGTAWDASKYAAEDIIDPKVDATYAVGSFVAGYYPAKVGVNGVAPVIAKTDALKLYFDEDVKVGTGKVEIRYWDGELAKAAMSVSVAADKRTVTLGDLTGLPTNEEYYAIVQSGIVVDNTVDENPYAGMSDVKVWKFTLKDDAYPVANVFTPTTNNIPVTTDLTLNFDRPVNLGTTGYVAIYKSAAGGDAVQIWRAADNGITGAFSISGNAATVNIGNLDVNTQYFVEVAEGTFASAVDNTKVQAAINRSAWSFTTEVNQAPSIIATGYSPALNATNVTLNSDLEITFDMDVQAGSGIIQLHKADGTQLLNFPVNDANLVTFNGPVVKVNLPTLDENSHYYVIIPGTAIRNTTYTPEYFAGVIVPYQWSFNTVVDGTAPTLVSVSPDAATGLKPADVKLEMTLSEDVKLTATGGNVVIYNAADNSVVETIALKATDIVGAKVTVIPTMLKEQMSYYVNVEGTALTDKSATPNAFAGITTKTAWTFATGDFTAPKMVTVSPKATTLSDNHPAELVLTLDENVMLTATGGNVKICKVGTTTATVTIPLTAAMINGKVITITYDAKVVGGLDKNTDYYVLVDANALKDNAGIAFAGIADATAWTFKTGANFKTGIEDDVNVSFKVYPNPFVNELKVDNASELSRIVITSMTGQKVKEIVNPTSTIQTSELRSGVYFISLYVDDVVAKTERIVKR